MRGGQRTHPLLGATATVQRLAMSMAANRPLLHIRPLRPECFESTIRTLRHHVLLVIAVAHARTR